MILRKSSFLYTRDTIGVLTLKRACDLLDILEKKTLSVVVPVYNEANIIPIFQQRLKAACANLDLSLEVIYVNDGSRDDTLLILNQLREQDTTVAIVDLSRNFGKEIALQAGLDHAIGDAVVVIDVDLQDPPELIPEFVNHWEAGYDVVYATRCSRKGEGWFKKCSAFLFYRLIAKMSSVSIPKDTGDFRLLSRRAVDALKVMREKHRFMKGLFSWIGFSQLAVPFEREARVGGTTKWNYWKLLNLAIEGITSFSIAPLKLATFMGFITAVCAFLYALVIVYKTLMFGEPIQGYPSLMVVILFLGGIQLITLGIIGEYLGRTFDEAKQRPLYLTKGYLPALEFGKCSITAMERPHFGKVSLKN
jgi:glycosyltransferase involved in cell wall biosynthesis